MKRITLTQILLVFITFNLNAQVLVNQVWTSNSGQPDAINFPISEWEEIDWTSSITTISNELIIVGNTLQSATNTDILITKQNSEGQVLWEQTFAGTAGSNDYGLAVILDNNQNVLVAGVVTTNNQTTDIALLKYSPSGSLLWSSIIDGGNNSFDIVTALATDANNNIFLVGGTISSTSQSDWYISKFNSNGTQTWNTSYDYVNLHELPISIEIIDNGNISVAGFSNSANNVWDFTSLNFSGTNGSILSEEREEIPDLSISDAISITTDNNNNIYIAGSTTGFIDANQNIQLVKINNNFDVEWIKEIDAEGLEDKSKSIATDNEGNIIVAGNSQKTNTGTQITISKFAPNGELKFKRNYLAPSTFETAKVAKIKVNDEGDIFVTGSVERSGNFDFVTLMYDKEGTLRMEKFFEGEGETKDIANNIDINNVGEILITGKSEGDETHYTTVKYQVLKRSDEITFIDNKPHHRTNEFIVKFVPQHVNTNFVNDRTKRYGTIDEILEAGAASKISDRIEMRNAIYSKVYPRLSTSHTQSVTRLGETIPMPEFWSVFLVIIEEGQDVNDFIAQFADLPEYVVYAHHNHLNEHHTIPNDEFFASDDQSSLFPSDDFPNAHINVEPAWDIETGQNYTKVGVYDNVIFWAHEDFGDGTLEGSQIEGGWDFNNNTNITGVTDPESHGTACAGIIGAIRDNNRGIAGIAGGGLDAQGNDNEGVQLFSLGIFDGGFAGTDAVGPAIVEGAMFDETQNPTGYGLHIQNHSWGGPNQNPTIRNAVQFCFRNQCILVASRGNDGDETLNFPATYNDNWILSVGGSGTNGEHYDGDNGNDFIDGSGAFFDGSSFGANVDIIAPAVTENVMSLINPNFPWDAVVNGVDLYPPPVGNDNSYQPFNGTSAAAPHVSGVAALMYSRHHVNQGQPNNLAPEDVEFILQRYATDIVNDDQGFPIGYDNNNGWGRLNAFEAVSRIDGPQWQVFHNGAPQTINETVTSGYLNIGEQGHPLPIGEYEGEWVEVEHTYTNVFSQSTQIIDSWNRLSSTTGTSQNSFYAFPSWSSAGFDINGNSADVTITTFCFHATGDAITGQTGLDVWLPAPPEELRTAYSLHLFDPQATSTKDIEELGVVSVYPNPTDESINLQYQLSDAIPYAVQILDITGKVLLRESTSSERINSLSIDISSVSSGIYICQLLTDEGVVSQKIVKQ